MAAVHEIGTTIIAKYGMWECSGVERMDVRQRSKGVEGVEKWKKWTFRFSTFPYFATSMSTRGCCA